MKKYAKNLIHNLRKRTKAAITFLIASFIPWLVNILWESQVETTLDSYGFTIETIFNYLLNRPILLPCAVLAAYFSWAAIKTIQDQESWAGITFEPINDIFTGERYCGIKIVSDKDVNVENLKAEIVDAGMVKHFKPGQNFLFSRHQPFTLGWFIDANLTYENQILGRERELILVLTQPNGHNYEHGFMIMGKHDILVWQFLGVYMLTLRLSGEIEEKPMRPKKLHIFIEHRDIKTQKLRVRDVKAV